MGKKKTLSRTEHEFKEDVLRSINIPLVSYFRKIKGGPSTIGIPDVLGVVLGRFVALELKAHPNTASPRQAEEMRRITSCYGYSAVITLGAVKDGYVCVVCPTIPNPSGEPIVCQTTIDQLEGTPWYDDDNPYRAYELPIVRRNGKRAINPIRLINQIAERDVLQTKGDNDDGNETQSS